MADEDLKKKIIKIRAKAMKYAKEQIEAEFLKKVDTPQLIWENLHFLRSTRLVVSIWRTFVTSGRV